MCLNNLQYISAQILEYFTGTNISQRRRLIEPHVTAAVIKTSIPAKIEINVKGRRNVNGNLFLGFRVLQNVIACSIKVPWTPIRINCVAGHISVQVLSIENLFENLSKNNYLKQFVEAQIQTEGLFLFNSQQKQFADDNYKKNQVFNAQTQTFTSTSDCDLQANCAMFRRSNRLKRRQSQTLPNSGLLRAKLLDRYADLPEGVAMLLGQCHEFCRQSEHIH